MSWVGRLSNGPKHIYIVDMGLKSKPAVSGSLKTYLDLFYIWLIIDVSNTITNLSIIILQ